MFLNLFNKKVVTRIAPSPTGNLHIGTARTALFNYLYAKQNKGKFVVRIEDTDKERSTKEFEKNILDGMSWLGLKHNQIYRQSERTSIYEKYLQELVKSGKAYVSKETSGDRESVIRFKNPNKKISFTDEIRGEIVFDTTDLGDFVLAKSFTEPLYHLAVVIDDHEMKITHVIRGEDGISNTPRQILIQEAIGAKRPVYAHLPLILGQDKSKLSKRHGATSITAFEEQGYLKKSLINFLAFLGWNPGTDQEIFSAKELIESFDLKKVSKSGAIFNIEKLKWINGQYLKKLDDAKFLKYIKNVDLKFSDLDKIKLKEIILERISNFEDLEKMIEAGEFDFMKKEITYDSNKILWKNQTKTEAIKNLEFLYNILSQEFFENKNQDDFKNIIWEYVEEKGKGDVLWPLRYALSGKEKSPDPFTLLKILGKEKSLERIKNAIQNL